LHQEQKMVAYKAALTTTEVDKLPLRDKDYRINLGLSGLYVNVWRGGGPPTFTLWCRCKSGRVRQPTLGRRPTMTADEAFTRAIDWLRVVRDGGDPYQDFQDEIARQRQAQAETCGALLPLFVVKKCAKIKSGATVERVLRQAEEPKPDEIVEFTLTSPHLASSSTPWAGSPAATRSAGWTCRRPRASTRRPASCGSARARPSCGS
jgi:hypothetical protein